MRELRVTVLCAGLMLAAVPSPKAQIADRVVVFGHNNWALRFDRRLDFLGATVLPSTGSVGNTTKLGIDAQGVAWIPFDALSVKNVVRMNPDGSLLPIVTIGHNPLMFVAAEDGRVYGITRIPLSSPGPAYGFGSDASVLWVNPQGPNMDTVSFPQKTLMTTAGNLWIGTPAPPPGQFWERTLLMLLSTADGSVLRTYWPTDLTNGSGDEVLPDLVATIDGTMWMHRWGPASPTNFGAMERTDGTKILESFILDGAGSDGQTTAIRVDGAGKLYMVSASEDPTQNGKYLYRFNPASPSAPEVTYTMGGLITGFALGANGDEAYVMVAPLVAPLTRRLERVNLVTGRKSSRPTDAWNNAAIPYGDPTGFVYANIVDRAGDNDGDGIPNGVETAARSNPFDPLSRPDGPRVFVDFAPTSNAPVLIFQDPDGLLNLTKGLDLATVSLKVGVYGEVLQFLLPFLTSVVVSPDGTQATAVFGVLHLASNAKLKFEARVADKTGAVGWDFQVSPPGDL